MTPTRILNRNHGATLDKRNCEQVDESPRQGKILALFAVSLPVMLAVAGLVLDSGELVNEARIAQHATDAAASAAAMCLKEEGTPSEATAVAEDFIHNYNGLGAAEVDVYIPPSSGPFAGDPEAVEVIVYQPAPRHFLNFVGGSGQTEVRTRAVARYKPVTEGAALVALDPDPAPIAVADIAGISLGLPPFAAGIEVLGTASVQVDGAVLINTEWGGVDERGNPAGRSAPPPVSLACLDAPLTEKLRARNIRVVGGVDNPSHYGHFINGEPNPVRANRLPVPDPLIDLPVPTLAADKKNVDKKEYGGVSIINTSIFSQQTLKPGVYDWIEVLSGRVRFKPGVYIIRGVHPITGIALNLASTWVTAEGVMFYITDSDGYSPDSGEPDAGDGESAPPPPALDTMPPSVFINSLLFLSSYSGLDDPGSPYDGIFIFQRRADRRPIVLVSDLVWLGNDMEGAIYAKWGHVLMVGQGFGETRVAAGSIRMVTIGNSVIAPGELFPPAEDVVIAE